jgi:tetratricopeptide (TPR) repeat protein
LLIRVQLPVLAAGDRKEGATNFQTAYGWVRAGNEKFNNKDYVGAISDYSRSIDLEPNLSVAYSDRGVAKFVLYHFADATHAIADLNRAISLDPKSDFAYFSRGNVEFLFAHYPDAIADYNQAIALAPKEAQAYYNCGYAYYKLGGNKVNYRKSIADYDRGAQLDGSYKPAFWYRDSAMAALDKAVGP